MSFGILFLLLLFIILPVIALCVVKSIVSKKNLYGIPAAILALYIVTIYLPDYISDLFNGNVEYWGFTSVLYFLLYFVFYPMLAIFLFTRANKGILALPFMYHISIYSINFFDDFEYYDGMSKFSYFLWLTAIIFAIVVIFARKPLKNIFFVPGAILLLESIITRAQYGFDTFSLIYDVVYISMIVLICKYVVTEAEENPKSYIPQPVYAQPVPDYNYQHNNVGNNYNTNNNYNTGNNYNTQPVNNVTDELVKYKAMLDNGLISKEDYEEKKAKILGL